MDYSPPKAGFLSLLLAGMVFVLLGFLFYPTLKEIALICWTDDDYSHGVLLPFVALFMIWDSRGAILERLQKRERSTVELRRDFSIWSAELLLLVGLLLFFLGQASGINYASWLAFFPMLLASIQLVFGRTVAWALAPPVLLLLMAKPIPDSLVVRLFWPLQVLAARASKVVLDLFDVPVYMSGNIIEIPQMKLLVEEACSGMRSVMALLTLSFIVIYFIKTRLFSSILLIASAILLAISLNISRVALTGVLAHFYDPKTATGFFHTFSGMVVFVVGLPILYGIGMLLLRLEKGKNSGGTLPIKR